MNRLEEIKKSIQDNILNRYTEYFTIDDYIFTTDILQRSIWDISSDLNIDYVESDADWWYQVTAYIKTELYKWYTVVLDSDYIMRDETLEELAQSILDYENEANSLIIKTK